jgi:GAF domain-containing protein
MPTREVDSGEESAAVGIGPTSGRRSLLERHQSALLELAKFEVTADDLDLALRIITQVSARTLLVERVGIWVFDEERTKITCLDLFEQLQGSHSKGQIFFSRDAPDYFVALEENRALAAHDVLSDPRTAELVPTYLTPLGIVSMLDAPIRQAGKLIGVVCHEHIGSMRFWTPEEQHFASSVADMAALALEHMERVRAEQELRHRNQLLDGVARAANRLFADAESDVRERDSLLEGLAAAGRAATEAEWLDALKSGFEASEVRIVDGALEGSGVVEAPSGALAIALPGRESARHLTVARGREWTQADRWALEAAAALASRWYR